MGQASKSCWREIARFWVLVSSWSYFFYSVISIFIIQNTKWLTIEKDSLLFNLASNVPASCWKNIWTMSIFNKNRSVLVNISFEHYLFSSLVSNEALIVKVAHKFLAVIQLFEILNHSIFSEGALPGTVITSGIWCWHCLLVCLVV